MRLLLPRAHTAVGILGMLAFVLTGQYMHWVHDHLAGMPDGPRLLHRSAHIYLMWASLLNLALGTAGASRVDDPMRSDRGGRILRCVQGLGSALVLAAPLGIAVSFFTESANVSLVRPLCRYSIYAAALGTGLHALCGQALRRRP